MRSNLVQRLLAALVAVPLLLALLYLGPPWGWAAFLAAATTVGALELFGMTHPGDRPSQLVGLALTLGVFGVVWTWGTDARALLVLLLILPLAGMLLTLARLGDMQTAALRVAAATFGPLYLGGGMAALAMLRREGGADGPGFVVLALVLSWFSDTGAYFAGRFLGRHKLYEAVSPKKTVEGALGGLAFSVLGAVIGHFVYVRSLPLVPALVLGVVAGALGQAGDLGESLIKRSVGAKDSGSIIPGHGGILDRVDALLVTATMTYVYLMFWWQG
ncbi:phosphatidate cytidylyltransferase [Chondromyces apiculatus]|uniref:Phosphatidate cytidylyltransferase n=1 Tax=Chondromyces apiculatus DSM 436 TaxID=1192034 RepID=A0A017T9Y3_9BACT|nr:phosphatidate cytidylyltransferase [Chondromyces apiculatus]EYF05752.1 Phosphatidate cytidylyltransferase [Chondromyces apiculatus DSM 436]